MDSSDPHTAPRSCSTLPPCPRNSFDGTLISDYNKGFLTHSTLVKIIPMLPKPIFVDSKKKDLSAFSDCILKINKHEFETSSIRPADCELIVTMGDKGAKWKGRIYPAQKVHDVFDVCGAVLVKARTT